MPHSSPLILSSADLMIKIQEISESQPFQTCSIHILDSQASPHRILCINKLADLFTLTPTAISDGYFLFHPCWQDYFFLKLYKVQLGWERFRRGSDVNSPSMFRYFYQKNSPIPLTSSIKEWHIFWNGHKNKPPHSKMRQGFFIIDKKRRNLVTIKKWYKNIQPILAVKKDISDA